ncbi:MAG: DUF3168 domain-containing protein [Acidimicrobiales bacterium]
MPETMPDVEGAVRAALRADSGVSALVGTRVLFGVPSSPTWPLVTVQRVGGGDDPGEAPIDLGLVQIDCYGAEHNKAQAWAVVSAVRTWARSVRGATALTEEVTAYGIDVESVIWAPDAADRPRYSVTALVTARSTQAA